MITKKINLCPDSKCKYLRDAGSTMVCTIPGCLVPTNDKAYFLLHDGRTISIKVNFDTYNQAETIKTLTKMYCMPVKQLGSVEINTPPTEQ